MKMAPEMSGFFSWIPLFFHLKTVFCQMTTSIIFWSRIRTFFYLCFKRSTLLLRSFSYQNNGRRWTLRMQHCEKLNKLQYGCDFIDDVTLISHMSSERFLTYSLTQSSNLAQLSNTISWVCSSSSQLLQPLYSIYYKNFNGVFIVSRSE